MAGSLIAERPNGSGSGDNAAAVEPSAVEGRGLYAGYQGFDAVAGVDLNIPQGELVALVGPNGAGKSTLLKLVMGLLQPRQGWLFIKGLSASKQRRAGNIAYMPQQETLDWDFPASVWDVVFSARYTRMRSSGMCRFLPQRWCAKEHHRAVEQALSSTDMSACAPRHISALSGGQRKRVLLARALAQGAELLLLDEPLVGVDAASEQMIFGVLRELRAAGRTVVLVTHDVAGARRYADRIILFNRRVIASGKPEEVLSDELLMQTADPSFARSVREIDR
ncbi:metal ABC transporter ATP-binding protein [Halorhodospira halochloris]|uniref:metal ABC transporter ATP-binding protein n=1 Tax=Halorhodospira halochloris TaxID=1052 RepID=UPI00076F6415|nr:metal ABC transporter ATP-binding protein [Halorhodospira halochloris]MCG5529469.1 metal ABC transporter ATP-binding protein [Halorhodospira halochloris]